MSYVRTYSSVRTASDKMVSAERMLDYITKVSEYRGSIKQNCTAYVHKYLHTYHVFTHVNTYIHTYIHTFALLSIAVWSLTLSSCPSAVSKGIFTTVNTNVRLYVLWLTHTNICIYVHREIPFHRTCTYKIRRTMLEGSCYRFHYTLSATKVSKSLNT